MPKKALTLVRLYNYRKIPSTSSALDVEGILRVYMSCCTLVYNDFGGAVVSYYDVGAWQGDAAGGNALGNGTAIEGEHAERAAVGQ